MNLQHSPIALNMKVNTASIALKMGTKHGLKKFHNALKNPSIVLQIQRIIISKHRHIAVKHLAMYLNIKLKIFSRIPQKKSKTSPTHFKVASIHFSRQQSQRALKM
jgi:hypothetical protein